MPDSQMLRKITGPTLPITILYREALITKLTTILTEDVLPTQPTSTHIKLVLLYAPAGYGKTTLLADFSRHTTMPCCWYFLDSNDTDKIAFLECLLASIRCRFPDFGFVLDPLLASAIAADVDRSAGIVHCEAVIDALAMAIASEISERFVLFLCNYHTVNDSPRINDLMQRFLQKMPPQCVVLIESRAIPDLEFATLLARREMFGIGSTLLHFSAQEICDLAHIQGVAPLSYAKAEQLTISFDGWIAGILLGTHLGDVQFLHVRRSIQSVGGSTLQLERQDLFAYVVNEVFGREPAMYAFLKEAAVLQQMTPDLCNALLNRSDAAEYLQRLEQQGLFVTGNGEGVESIYTCHSVLRELLCAELRRVSPERFVELHCVAAELLCTPSKYESVMYHAQESGVYTTIVNLINETSAQMLAQGHSETLARWLDALPSETLICSPRLLLMRANIYLMTGEQTLVLPLLDAASSLLRDKSPLVESEDLLLLQTEVSVLRSKVLFLTGAYTEAQTLCQQALTQVSVDTVALRAEAHILLGVCANLLGDFTAGIAQLQKALLLLGRRSGGRQTAEIHSTLASAYSLLGNFALAEHHSACALRFWESLHDGWGKVNNLIRMGLIKQRQELFAEAETLFKLALSIARGVIAFRRGEAYALVSLGELYLDQGLYEQALAAIEDGLVLARLVRDSYLINCTFCSLAMTYVFMGDAPTALLLISEIDIHGAENKQVSYEKVLRELTYGTILLYQHHYAEAYACLSGLERSLRTIGLKREQLQTILRLAACQLAQDKISETLQYLNMLLPLIVRGDYEQLVLSELRRLPDLLFVVQNRPEMTSLCAQLHLTIALQPIQEITLPPPPVPPDLFPSILSPVVVVESQSRLKIQALGETIVLIEDVPITRWRMARSMELYFFLLNSDRPVRKEQIITALWSEIDEQINQTFHSTIYYLRKAIGERCVISHAGTYSLDLSVLHGSDVWYDVALFQQHDIHSQQALAAKDDGSARAALQAMVELYQGDYVQPFYSDWCIPRRDELRNMYIAARRQLAQLAWRAEEFAESALQWQHILAVDNCQEDAYFGLMRCSLRQGKRNLALRQYQRCVETLQQELSIAPGPAIQNLYQRLRAASPAKTVK